MVLPALFWSFNFCTSLSWKPSQPSLWAGAPPTTILPTTAFHPPSLLLGIILFFPSCLSLSTIYFSVQHSPLFSVSFPSPSLLTSHLITLLASGYSVNFHIFFLLRLIPSVFPSLCLVCPWGNRSTTMLSVTAAPHPPPLLLLFLQCLFFFSWTLHRLLTLLPSVSPCLSCLCSVTNCAHICMHALFAVRHAHSLLFLPSVYHSHPSPLHQHPPSPLYLPETCLLPPLIFISCSFSIRLQTLFAAIAVQHWSFLTNARAQSGVTDPSPWWSIQPREMDGTMSRLFTLLPLLSFSLSLFLHALIWSYFLSFQFKGNNHSRNWFFFFFFWHAEDLSRRVTLCRAVLCFFTFVCVLTVKVALLLVAKIKCV